MTQDESTKTPLPKERFVRVKQILSPLKGDRWLTVGVYGAIATVGVIFGSLAWNWSDLQTNPSEQSKQKFDASLSVVSTSATIAAGIVLFLNFRVAQKKLEQETTKAETDKKLAESRLQMERFNKAVEMLGKNDSIHLRLGGIYALETIAADSNPEAPDEDYRQVLEVLTAFVRENSPYSPRTIEPETPLATPECPNLAAPDLTASAIESAAQEEAEIPPLPTDIQAVLTVLNRRKHRDKDWEHHRLDLRKTDLSRADLEKANLQQANFGKANFQKAILIKANFQKADLTEANLQKAHLWKANLQKAHLWKANLHQADIGGASLQNAKLGGANLQKANLWKANLHQADLGGANLYQANLGGTNLQNAKLWEANLQKANLTKANLQNADLGAANLQGAIFWDPDLIGTELAEVKEKAKANLQSAENWEYAQYDPDIREWLGLPPEVAQPEEETE